MLHADIPVTRRQRRMAAQFERTYGVRVERQINFDKVLILKPPENVDRRRTIGGHQSTPNIKSCLKQRRSLGAPRSVTFDLSTLTPTNVTTGHRAPTTPASSQPTVSGPQQVANTPPISVANADSVAT